MYEPLIEAFCRAKKPTEGVVFLANTIFQQNVCHVKGLRFSSKIAKDLIEMCLKECAHFKMDSSKENNPAAYFTRVCCFVASRLDTSEMQKIATRDVYAEVEYRAFMNGIEKLIANANL